MESPIYKCTQEEETLTTSTMWKSCKANQPAFFAFSPRYTILYIDAKITAIDDAGNLPNEAQRQNAESTAYNQLIEINTDDCTKWQLLKRYISKAFPANLHQTKWNAAGMASYEAAANKNWESATTLMKLGNQFIIDNVAALTLDLNMPPAFQATFAGSKTAFDEKLSQFKTAEQTNTTGADTKVSALNANHIATMEMALDGQEILKDNEGLVKQFIYEQVLKLYAGTGNQGYKGNVTNAATNEKIKSAKISVQGTPHTTDTDALGNYAMRNVAHATDQTIIAECEGYQTATIPGNSVAIGVMTTLDIKLTPNP